MAIGLVLALCLFVLVRPLIFSQTQMANRRWRWFCCKTRMCRHSDIWYSGVQQYIKAKCSHHLIDAMQKKRNKKRRMNSRHIWHNIQIRIGLVVGHFPGIFSRYINFTLQKYNTDGRRYFILGGKHLSPICRWSKIKEMARIVTSKQEENELWLFWRVWACLQKVNELMLFMWKLDNIIHFRREF